MLIFKILYINTHKSPRTVYFPFLSRIHGLDLLSDNNINEYNANKYLPSNLFILHTFCLVYSNTVYSAAVTGVSKQ